MNRRKWPAEAIAMLLGAALACPGQAGSLRGRVLDVYTRQPVLYAEVAVPVLDAGSLTDSTGAFEFRTGPNQRALDIEVSRVGYRPRAWKDVPVSRPVELFLVPDVINLAGVTVSAYRIPTAVELSGPVSVISRADAQHHGQSTIADALSAVPSVVSHDYVNFSSVALCGANAEQTLVAIDGVRLNSAQNGTFDLTTMPLALADRIEVARGGNSALYGTSAVGGVVNVLTPEPSQFSGDLKAGLGSFGRRTFSLTHTNWYAPVGYAIAGQLTHADNDFPFTDAFDSARTMRNADLTSRALLAKGVYRSGPHCGSLLGEFNQTQRGTYPSDSARRDDTRGQFILNYELQATDRSRTSANAYYQQSWQNYRDPAWALDDTHRLQHLGGQLEQAYYAAPWLLAMAGAEAGDERLTSTAVGTPERLTTAGWLQLRLERFGFRLTPALRYEQLVQQATLLDSTFRKSTARVLSPKLSLVYSGLRWLSLYSSAGRSFRAPTFNELYWPEDPWTRGNPNLKPEWATSVDFYATVTATSLSYARLGAWHSHLTNLIQWQPDSNRVLQPVNLDTATITGIELEMVTRDLGPVGVTYTTTLMWARSHGRDLIYRPWGTLGAHSWFTWKLVEPSLGISYVDKRYTVANNTDSLPGFLLVDVGLALTPTFGRVGTALRGGIRNLFDRQYEVMKGYPVPGRNWYAEMELKL